MKNISKFIFIISLFLLFSTSCSSLLQTYVRFENRSVTKTVNAIWDGVNAATLAPGEITEYMEVNSGFHTIKWENALNNRDLTTLGYPNLVAGSYHTYPYDDN